jgi:DNA polymerase I
MSLSTILLVDGHSLAFRSYYALAKSRQGALRTSEGIPTSICFGFLNSLMQVIETEKPDLVAIAFDLGSPTFRHEADVNYKSDRKETPEDFIPDIENLQRLLTAFNLRIATEVGYEADDVLGTLAIKASEAGYRVKILSGDRDLFQLVDTDKNIAVLYLDNSAFKGSTKTGYREFDAIAVVEKLGILPEQVVDYKALCGDKSDCISGVRGIGEKTAVKLLKEYPTLSEIYDNLDEIKGKTKQLLIDGKEDALHSQFMARIVTNIPLEIDLDNLQLEGFDRELVLSLLNRLELKKFVKEIDKLDRIFSGKNTIAPETKYIVNNNSNTKSNISKEVDSDDRQLSLFELPVDNEDSNLSVVNDKKKERSKTPIKEAGDIVANHDEIEVVAKQIQPQIIDTQEKLQELVKILERQTNINYPVAWDTETSSLEPWNAKLIGIGCCWGKNNNDIAYIPIQHNTGEMLPQAEILSALRSILEDSKYPKAFQNTKFDRLVFRHQGINLSGVVFDTMLASYIINPENSHNLTDLSKRHLTDIVAKSYKDLNLAKGQTIADLDIETAANYCGLDAYSTYLLASKLRTELETTPELYKLLLEVEQPLEIVLADMETRGINLDRAYLHKLSQELDTDLQTIQQQTYQDATEEFNLDSPKQLSEILFEKLGLDKKKSTKTKTGYSTNHAVLEKLQGEHPIIDRILEYRTLAKLKSTYVDALPTLVRPDTNRLHTDFNQTITSTGRLSSSNPNLQNIPIRTEFSRRIRQAFIPQENWLLVSADYSQIELRILAHLSQEPVLIEAYQNNEDVHTVTAKLIFEKAEITSTERRLGKIINFGVIYGMGAQKFAREAGVSSKEAKEFIEKYRQKYARVFAYLEGLKREAIANGFVTTILGRRRYVTFESSSLRQLLGSDPDTIDLDNLDYSYIDAQVLRSAANAPIQGSCADIIKVASIELHRVLNNYRAKLLLQVHDELILEMPSEEWQELKETIEKIMSEAIPLTVPLVVEVRAGDNWMEAK